MVNPNVQNDYHVAVGVPLYGYVPSFVYWRHLGWIVENTVRGYLCGLQGSENCYLPWARRDIVNQTLEPCPHGKRFTHLFFLDQDVICPADTIPKLLAHKKPIVGALYYQKVKGHAPVAGMFEENGLGWTPMTVKAPLQKVEVIGMGATLVNMDVFDELDKRYGNADEGVGMGWFDMNARTGEDIEFCRRAISAGFQPWVDTTIETMHVGATPVTRRYHEKLGTNEIGEEARG